MYGFSEMYAWGKNVELTTDTGTSFAFKRTYKTLGN